MGWTSPPKINLELRGETYMSMPVEGVVHFVHFVHLTMLGLTGPSPIIATLEQLDTIMRFSVFPPSVMS